MVSKSPKDRVVGPLPNGLFIAYKWGVIRSPLTSTGSPSNPSQMTQPSVGLFPHLHKRSADQGKSQSHERDVQSNLESLALKVQRGKAATYLC